MKNLFRSLIVGLVFSFIVYGADTSRSESNSAAIYSTTAGGSWNQTTSWIGGVVPGIGSEVVIQ